MQEPTIAVSELPPPPPPPPPAKSRTGLWIGIAIGVVVLCLCCVLVVAGVLIYTGKIPLLSNLLGISSSRGLQYSNTTTGISLTYPADWVYLDDTGSTTFASSQDIIDNIQKPLTQGAALVIINPLITTAVLPSDVSPTDAVAVLNYIMGNNVTSGMTPVENPHAYIISTYPAASGVYSDTGSNGVQQATYMTVIVKGANVLLIISITPQGEWSQRRPQFEGMLNSLSFAPGK
jgi:hypothetical protein